MFEVLIRGGVLMVPIAVCSVLAVAIIIEKSIKLRIARATSRAFLFRIQNSLRLNRIDEAQRACEMASGPVAAIFRAGLARAGQTEERIRQAIQEAGEKEISILERHVGTLGTLAGGAPLLGFLGTVVGMIRAFQQIERLGGNVNASVLAGGIWQALLTTAAGLAVGLVCFFAHNYFVGRIQFIVREMEERSSELIETLTNNGGEGDET
jgi:biopolymer transport protein ExbB